MTSDARRREEVVKNLIISNKGRGATFKADFRRLKYPDFTP